MIGTGCWRTDSMSDPCYFQALAPLEHHPSGTHWLITCKGTADAATNFLLEPTSIVSRNLRVNPHMFIKFHHISPITCFQMQCCCLHRCHAHHNRTDHDLWPQQKDSYCLCFFKCSAVNPALFFQSKFPEMDRNGVVLIVPSFSMV